eukprot:5530108-Prymnesium_polylepis.1
MPLSDTKLLDELSYPIRCEVALYRSYQFIMAPKIINMLGTSDGRLEQAVIKQLVTKMGFAVFSPGDFAIEEGDVGNEVYFISAGNVSVLFHNTEVASLEIGDCFGEIALIMPNTRRTASIRANCFVETQVLRRLDFEECLEGYPRVKERMEAAAKVRMEQLAVMTEPKEPDVDQSDGDDSFTVADAPSRRNSTSSSAESVDAFGYSWSKKSLKHITAVFKSDKNLTSNDRAISNGAHARGTRTRHTHTAHARSTRALHTASVDNAVVAPQTTKGRRRRSQDGTDGANKGFSLKKSVFGKSTRDESGEGEDDSFITAMSALEGAGPAPVVKPKSKAKGRDRRGSADGGGAGAGDGRRNSLGEGGGVRRNSCGNELPPEQRTVSAFAMAAAAASSVCTERRQSCSNELGKGNGKAEHTCMRNSFELRQSCEAPGGPGTTSADGGAPAGSSLARKQHRRSM